VAEKAPISIDDPSRAEEALRESEHRCGILTEALPQLVWSASRMVHVTISGRWQSNRFRRCGNIEHLAKELSVICYMRT
jgi:hypothetical protein